MLEVSEPPNLRRASLISEIYSESHTITTLAGKNKPKFTSTSARSDVSNEGKKRNKSNMETAFLKSQCYQGKIISKVILYTVL